MHILLNDFCCISHPSMLGRYQWAEFPDAGIRWLPVAQIRLPGPTVQHQPVQRKRFLKQSGAAPSFQPSFSKVLFIMRCFTLFHHLSMISLMFHNRIDPYCWTAKVGTSQLLSVAPPPGSNSRSRTRRWWWKNAPPRVAESCGFLDVHRDMMIGYDRFSVCQIVSTIHRHATNLIYGQN